MTHPITVALCIGCAVSASAARAQALPPSYVSVMDHGAVADATTDDTAAVQAAIDSVRRKGGTVYLPAGTYAVTSLDLTDIGVGFCLLGDGVNATRLVPTQDGVHVLDLSGSRFVRLQSFQIGAYNQNVVPQTAILLGQIESLVSNALHFEGLYISGRYSVATLYCYGVPSSTALDCDFYNYLDAGVSVVAFTHDNYAEVRSRRVEIMEGFSSCSDWTWMGCEIHEMSRPSGRTSATALRLDGTTQMRWIGGNISGAGPQLVRFSDGPKLTVFEGTTFYSETGTPPEVVFLNEDRAEGVSVTQCVTQAERAVFAGADGAVYDNVHFAGKPSAFGPRWLLDCSEGRLIGSMLLCDGLPVRTGSIQGTLLVRPGRIAAEAQGTLAIGQAD